jgi:ferredoxin-like protein FixX
MHNTLKTKRICANAAKVIISVDGNEDGQIIICSDYEIQVKRVKKSNKDFLVTVKEELKKEKLRDAVKINVCPAGINTVKYTQEIIDKNNLKITIGK